MTICNYSSGTLYLSSQGHVSEDFQETTLADLMPFNNDVIGQERETDLDTMGSAAWLGPHLPRVPLLQMPVLPIGFLQLNSSVTAIAAHASDTMIFFF